MSNDCRTVGKWLCVLGVFLLAGELCRAAESATPRPEAPKPVLVVSVASYQKLIGDLELVGKLADRPEIGTAVEGMLSLATGGKGLMGLDKNRPINLVVQTDGQRFTPYLLVPVSNLEKLLGVVEPLLRQPIAKKDGLYELPLDAGKTLYVQQKGADWAVVVQTAEELATVPEQLPAEVQQKLPAHSSLSVAVLVKNIAPQQRQQWAERLRKDADRELTPRAGETEEDFKLRKWVSEWAVDWLASALDQLEQVRFGMGLDTKAEKLILEIMAQPVPGSSLAEGFRRAGESRSAFAGVLLPDATLTAHAVLEYPTGEFHQVAPLLEMLKVRALQRRPRSHQTPEQAQVQKEITVALFDLVEKTLKSGRADGAFSVVLRPDALTLLAGTYVADAQAVEKLLHRAVEAAQKVHPDEVQRRVKLQAEEVQGVSLHVARVPIPAGAVQRAQWVRLVGEELEVVLGTGQERLYLAMGKEAQATLRKAIQRASEGPQKVVAPLGASLSVKPILAVLAEHGTDTQRNRASQLLEKISSKDHLRLAVESTEGSLQFRIEVERDVLAILAKWAGIQTE